MADLFDATVTQQPLLLEAIRIEIPGEPIGKGRPRVGNVAGRARLFTPAKTVGYESLVAHAGMLAMSGRPVIATAVQVDLDIRLPVAASWSQKQQRLALAGVIYPTKKPDIDNVEKAIFDGLNNVVWKDDVQVCSVTKRKRFSDRPGVTITITPMSSA